MSSELSSSPGLRPGDALAARADRAAILVVGAGLQALCLCAQRLRQLELAGDWPALTPELRWPGAGVFVMGGLGTLHLGPAAANIFAGREGARRIPAGLLHRALQAHR